MRRRHDRPPASGRARIDWPVVAGAVVAGVTAGAAARAWPAVGQVLEVVMAVLTVLVALAVVVVGVAAVVVRLRVGPGGGARKGPTAARWWAAQVRAETSDDRSAGTGAEHRRGAA